MGQEHRHDAPSSGADARDGLSARVRRMTAALRRGRACCEAKLQAFTMLLPDGSLALSCRQRLAELIGSSVAGDGEADACRG